jgi:hypothetical protein
VEIIPSILFLRRIHYFHKSINIKKPLTQRYVVGRLTLYFKITTFKKSGIHVVASFYLSKSETETSETASVPTRVLQHLYVIGNFEFCLLFLRVAWDAIYG